jgi:tetratricopeptide (TPR) repeat protein
MLIQEADEAVAGSYWTDAEAKFKAALAILGEILAGNPDWHTGLVDFRIRYCRSQLAMIKPKVPVAPGPTAAVAMPAPPSEAEQIRQLQAELQKTRDEVKALEKNRDELAATLQGRLKEPAPRDRLSAQQTIDQLRALQAVNEAAMARLEAAKEKAARAEQLEDELRHSQERIQALETERTGLNAKLQEALAKVAPTETNARVEELLKQNTELTAQLAIAQAQITKMRDEVAGAATPADVTETVRLRVQVGDLRSELQQTKVLLVQRTEELGAARAESEKTRADNVRLTQSQDDLMAKLNESDRQLRAARASTEKDNEIIQELRKENALMRDIAGKKGPETQAKAPPPAKPRGGFLWFKPKPEPAPAANPADSSVGRSETGKLTAAVKAPAPPTARETPPEPATPTATDPVPETGKESPIVHSLLTDARAAIARRDLPTAASRFQSVLEQEPANSVALSNLGVIYYQQSRLDEAEDLLRKAVAASPGDSQAHAVLGVIYFRKAHTEDAYSELTRAVALNPRNAEAHNYLGIVMSEKGWATAAEQEVRRAIELKPEYADAHFNLAVIYSREKTPRLELARYHYQKARDLGAERDSSLETALAAAPASPAKP